MHAWCSGRDVTFGEQCLIDEVTHFSVWSDYRSQSEASTSPTLSLSGSPICLTEFDVKTTGTERKGGGIHFGILSLLQHQILVSQVEGTHLQSWAFIWGMNETCVQHTHIWWYNQRGTMVGADLSVFSWEALLPDNDSDECTHIRHLIHLSWLPVLKTRKKMLSEINMNFYLCVCV